MYLIHDVFHPDYFYQAFFEVSMKIINSFSSNIIFLTVNNLTTLNKGRSVSVSFSSNKFRNNDNKHIRNCSSVHCSSNE